MSQHGNYGWLHYTEAIAQAEERNELLVTTDEVITVSLGTEAVQALHVVAEPTYWEHDEPKGYVVELVRPRWLYGSEGHLHSIRWVGRVEELTDEELAGMTENDPYLDLLPDCGSYLWAIPKQSHQGHTWERCRLPWWQAFREPAEPPTRGTQHDGNEDGHA